MLNTLQLGQVEILEVEETTIRMPFSMFGLSDQQLHSERDWLEPRYLDTQGEWENVIRSWVVTVDGKLVVVDPCTGNGRHFPDFPPAHMLDTPYLERFAATGFRPEEVDFVFCTHLHMDHCGWNTQLRAGRYVPTFPNARYIMARREYERWDPGHPDHVPVRANAGTFENSVRPVCDAGLVQLVPDSFRISDSLFVEPAHGHTAGHSLLRMVTGEREAYFVGDAFHHPLEIRFPEIDAGTCECFADTLVTRRRLIATCLEKNALLIPAHFPDPFGGTLSHAGGRTHYHAMVC
ncbi:MBL fold metallo-hydrolase [Haliea sp. E17]|uniref:MBL fold metallo-hydrolase n=1 Tax=Haliea sp. E17 TaxID=3401576 RepID=UPI003AAB0C6B